MKNDEKNIKHQSNLEITGAGATVTADRLIKDKLAKHKYSNIDRRVVYITITNKGKEKLNAIRKKRKRFMSSIMNNISAGTQNKMITSLETLFIALNKIESKDKS